MELRQKVAVVTGASSGLGRRFALDLAHEGAVVIGIARRPALLEALERDLQARSASSSTVVCDITDTTAFTDALGELEQRYGCIDVLLNNAGIGDPHAELAGLEPYRAVMETNYFAAVAGTITVVPGMCRRGEGVVVNVSSDAGRAPGPREVAYGASKAALSAFTESLAMSVEAYGVHLHVLYPGWVPTAMATGSAQAGMPTPPAMVRRSEEQVSRALIRRIGGPRIDIDATWVARFAPLARTLVPSLYRRAVRKAAGAPVTRVPP